MLALLSSTFLCAFASFGFMQTDWARERLDRASTSDAVGIWRDDARYGYGHRPGASGVHQTSEFSVRYTIDDEGCRAVPAAAAAEHRVLFLGDSFTFGHGVADHEAFPALVAREWPSAQVRNCGVMGWGTGQAFLALEEQFQRTPRPTAVIYGWTSADLQRNHLRRSWLATLSASGRRTVHFRLEEGRVELVGTADVTKAIADDAPGLADQEKAVTRALLTEMARKCAARGVRFVVAVLATRDVEDAIGDWLATHGARHGLDVVDLRSVRGPYFKKDGHPKAAWHAAVARALALGTGSRLNLEPTRRASTD